MAEPVRNPETGGRSLADILREAGIENPTRTGRRRRWDDMDDTGIRQRRADAAREDASARAAYGRRAGDLPLDQPEVDRSSGMPRVRDERFRRPQPGDARAPEERLRGERRRDGTAGEDRPRGDRRVDDRLRPDRAPGERSREERPREERSREERPRDERAERQRHEAARGTARETARDPAREATRDAVRDTGRRAPVRSEPPRPARGDGGPSTEAIPGMRPSGKPSVPGVAAAPAAAVPPSAAVLAGEAPVRERRGRRRAAVVTESEAGPATGRIPLVEDRAEPDAAPPEGALAWLRFAGELVVAAAVGVGVYFAFTVLWEMLPHLAVLASPLVVTGLVLGVSTWRQRSGRGQLGARLLGVLVFAGTVLTILPAAGLLSG